MSRRAEPKADNRPILVTMGDPAGIGPELAVTACAALGGRIGARPIKLVGDAAVFAAAGAGATQDILATAAHATRIPGKPDPGNARAIIEAIDLSVRLASDGEAAAVVTAPISKTVLNKAGFAFVGHTEYLAHLTGAPRSVMMLAGSDLRVVPVTIHLALADVPRVLSKDMIVETGLIVAAALKRDFAISNPRLAVAGLNPHAGEDGVLGREEIETIAPAVAALRARGIAIRGPLSADTLFHAEARAKYDAVLCMYHDQALIPLKTLAFWDGVNVTLGLPIVRTSPDHGTAFEIAGTGKANARSMIAAITLAAKMADARAR